MVWFRAYNWRTGGEIEDEATALRILHGRAFRTLGRIEKEQLLSEMIGNKHKCGRFVGEGPNIAVEKERETAVAKEE